MLEATALPTKPQPMPIAADLLLEGGSPGLVVEGGDSKSEGCESESRHQILDGHFSHFLL